ncbi:hypothetical protein LOC54_06175 [Acetobacter sp. AN02]|uniref:hypothetical protein n=1 Tax=Acetobacter sp. AN02 TaxID=2894186 RepID=UPI0024341741|nr:hypothetical protein [Acetobacter sp. AN02]MDG6094696.1 hypothetical protein [Acetobacter sp. AN02]
MSGEPQPPEPVVSSALKALVIGMGALIVLGTAVLIGVIVHRLSHGRPAGTLAAAPAASPVGSLLLHEPEGSRIVSAERMNDTTLAVRISGGGPDRILLWDITRGAVSGRLSLSPSN